MKKLCTAHSSLNIHCRGPLASMTHWLPLFPEYENELVNVGHRMRRAEQPIVELI
jgi:hypothetical protein